MNKIHLRSIFLLCTLLFCCIQVQAQEYKKASCYVFGFTASFSDSTVYFTDIQELDTAYFHNRGIFLYGRDLLSYQLRDYLSSKGFPHPTSVIFFSRKRSDIEKKYLKLKKQYDKGNAFVIKYLTTQEFKFSPVTPNENLMIINGGSQQRHK